jgi:alkylhydroperoxidase family enzyme
MAAESKPRIAPGTRAEIGLLNSAIVRLIGLALRRQPPHVFTTLARHRRLFRRWLWFAGALMPRGTLPRRDSELVILRVAHNTGSEYEREQHEQIGRRVGLNMDEIARVREGAAAPGWSERQAALLEASDQLHANREISDELWSRLAAMLEERQLIELCMLIGHYEMLAMTLNSLRVQPDGIAAGKHADAGR